MTQHKYKMIKKSFNSTDGTEIVFWASQVDQPKSNLVIVHGLGEHGRRYRHVADYFNRHGRSVFVWDARGHGISEGVRGHIPSMRQMHDDIRCYLAAIRAESVECPTFLFGHSLGALLTLDYLLHFPSENIQGYICTSPPLGEVGVPLWMIKLSRVASVVAPCSRLNVKLNVEHLSRDPAWIEQTKQDQLYHNAVSARLSVEIQKAKDRVQANAKQFHYPMLLMHGTADKVCDIEGSRLFYKKVDQENKIFLQYADAMHELFNDTIKDTVLSDMEGWMNSLC